MLNAEREFGNSSINLNSIQAHQVRLQTLHNIQDLVMTNQSRAIEILSIVKHI